MDHPYRDFQKTPVWTAIATAMAELESNQDLRLTSHPDHVIGFLCQQLAAKGLPAGTSLLKN